MSTPEPQRRALLASALSLALAPAAGIAATNPPPTPLADDVNAPIWPSAERIVLWPQEPPGMPAVAPVPNVVMSGPRGARALRISGVARPEINIFRPAHPNGMALLVVPGGGYSIVSVQNEGIEVARRFTPFGITICVLTYRLPGEGWANRQRVPLQDAQRAMRLLRRRSAQLGIDPAKLSVLGFSAGGHLAADLTTAYDEACYARVDDADALSARPACAGLIYPVASLMPGSAHGSTRDLLLGQNPSTETLARHSPALQVRASAPPCFVMHAMDDNTVPPESSFQMVAGCRKAGVPVEAHFFAKGGHGFGLGAAADSPAAQWPNLFEAWLRMQLA